MTAFLAADDDEAYAVDLDAGVIAHALITGALVGAGMAVGVFGVLVGVGVALDRRVRTR